MRQSRRQFLQSSAAIALAASTSQGAAMPSENTVANNDNTELTATTTFQGPHLQFDFPGLRIGCAEYDAGPTGCTVFHFPKGATVAADIRGGSHCSIYMDYIADGASWLNAICLAGGSFYGLEAATGVASQLLADRDYKVGFNDIALVTGAIIYDFRARNAIYPDKNLGRAALKAAVPNSFPLGPRGVGRRATCGKWSQPPYRFEYAGQGGAFAQFGDTKLAVFTVVNAVGSILDRSGKVVRGTFNPETNQRDRVTKIIERFPSSQPTTPSTTQPGGNTTLTVLVTNRKLDAGALRQLGREVHSSMSRCIEPFHTISDGDILFAATTNEIKSDDPNFYRLGVHASELAWDAVLSCYGEK
jgi:L-aminopeptidase/D-esterase-like protein